MLRKLFLVAAGMFALLAVLLTIGVAAYAGPGIGGRWLLLDLGFFAATLSSLLGLLIALLFVRKSKLARIVSLTAFVLLAGHSLYLVHCFAPHWLRFAYGDVGAAEAEQTGGAAPVVAGDLGQRLDAHMAELERKGFAGVILVAKGNDLVISKGYGYANKDRELPWTGRTVFDVGSLTKQFTAVAILRLEMQGKLSVDDPITRFFQNVPPDKTNITLHHLLTHTAGLKGGFGGDYEEMAREQIVSAALESELFAAPGKAHRYSNAGYSLLGAIVEFVSGKSYDAFLHEELFKPAGMKETGYLIPGWPEERLAHGYTAIGADWGTPLDHNWDDDGPWWTLRANGGILSTAEDLLKWHRALEGEAVLSAVAKQKLFHPHVLEEPGGDIFYAYGWTVRDTSRGTRVVGHDGSNLIFYADMKRYVDEDILFVIASNQTSHLAMRYEGGIVRVLFDGGE